MIRFEAVLIWGDSNNNSTLLYIFFLVTENDKNHYNPAFALVQLIKTNYLPSPWKSEPYYKFGATIRFANTISWPSEESQLDFYFIFVMVVQSGSEAHLGSLGFGLLSMYFWPPLDHSDTSPPSTEFEGTIIFSLLHFHCSGTSCPIFQIL